MSVTPNLCCDDTKNRGTYSGVKKPWTRSNPKVLVTIVTGIEHEEILSPCGHFAQQKL